MAKTSEAQLKAAKKWDQENKDKKKYIKNKSAAKRFIETESTQDDLHFLKGIIEERLNGND